MNRMARGGAGHWEMKRPKYVSPQITVGIVIEPCKHYAEEGVTSLRSFNVAPGGLSGVSPLHALSPPHHCRHKDPGMAEMADSGVSSLFKLQGFESSSERVGH